MSPIVKYGGGGILVGGFALYLLGVRGDDEKPVQSNVDQHRSVEASTERCENRNNVADCCAVAVQRYEALEIQRTQEETARTGKIPGGAILNWTDERRAKLSDCTMSAYSPEMWKPWACATRASSYDGLQSCWAK